MQDKMLIKYNGDNKLYVQDYGRDTFYKLLDSPAVYCVYIYKMGGFVPIYPKRKY